MYSLGIDFGTSGARATVVGGSDDGGVYAATSHEIVAEAAFNFSDVNFVGSKFADSNTSKVASDETLAALWEKTLYSLIEAIAPTLRSQIKRIAINGTSSTTLLCNEKGEPVTKPLMYNDTSARIALSEVEALAPPNSPATGATSTFTKAIWLHQQYGHDPRLYIAHQADWLSYLLHRKRKVTDYHNALKLGYDVRTLAYPNWLLASPIAAWLPHVVEPGEPISVVHPEPAKRLGLSDTCQICAGTTDSIAAFLASGATQSGEAVTSLGSTLVLKLLSTVPIEDQTFGVYSHRLGNLWLAGGASNTGGAVLGQFFSPEQLANLSTQIDPSQPCALNYYPLSTPGERFPINNPDYPPRLTPRPENDSAFLHGLLEGIARIETEGYQKLEELGAPKLRKIYTAGGGAKNDTWQTIRRQQLRVEVVPAAQTEAAYGSALLAMKGLIQFL